jgi:hypothetical protein
VDVSRDSAPEHRSLVTSSSSGSVTDNDDTMTSSSFTVT